MKLFLPKDRSSLCIGFNSNYSMKIGQYVVFKIKKLPTRKLHRERNHSFYSENVWGSIEVRGLRFASSVKGTQNFLFVLRSWQDEKTSSSISLPSSKLSISLVVYFKTVFHNMNLRRMHAQDLRGSFRVDVFDSKKDYPGNFDETFKVDSNDWFRVDYTMWRSLKVY